LKTHLFDCCWTLDHS